MPNTENCDPFTKTTNLSGVLIVQFEGALGEMKAHASQKARIPVVTEIMSADKLEAFLDDDIDAIQIGSRNMQNFELLKAVGKVNKPVLLKRGLCATIEEWLMSAEYIMVNRWGRFWMVFRQGKPLIGN